MAHILNDFINVLQTVVLDVLPIAAIIFVFQFLVLRRKPPRLGHAIIGIFYMLFGLTLFLIGLEQALFPVGKTMAYQLMEPRWLGVSVEAANWRDYGLVYLFAALMGFASTVAEPTLIVIALKAQKISGGAIGARSLRFAVGVGVGFGVVLGVWRIVSETPISIVLGAALAVMIGLTLWSRRHADTRVLIPLAYDSGGVTTSEVTVPLIAALAVGFAATLPNANPLIDGFGLIAFANVFAIMAVFIYVQLGRLWVLHARPASRGPTEEEERRGEAT